VNALTARINHAANELSPRFVRARYKLAVGARRAGLEPSEAAVRSCRDARRAAGERRYGVPLHYTDAIRADAIIEERCFVSGPRAARGFGIYATDIAPVGEETIDEVIVNCFNGDAQTRGGARASDRSTSELFGVIQPARR